jgi:phospholipid-binding lipoprotein MlaA
VSARLLILLPLLALAACSSIPAKEQRDRRDPWERMNRSVYKFNTVVDHAVLRPVAHGYVKSVPSPVRTGVYNVLSNLTYTDVMINDALQGKFNHAANDLARLLVNTVFGLGGLLDPASQIGLDRNNEDLGLTLGYYGVPPGPYFVVPLYGPSDVRDGLATVADEYMTPRPYLSDYLEDWVVYSVYAISIVNARVQLLPLDAAIDTAFDPYTFVRNAYLSRRQFLIEESKPSTSPELPPDDSGGPASGTAAPPAK